MKTILCYGDSNVRGFIPGTFDPDTGLAARYTKDKRWTGVLQTILGHCYNVIEDGINGRTTNLDEIFPGRPHRNGLVGLASCLEAHYPIDIVVLMIGTNDTKIQFNRSTAEIVAGMRQLITSVQTSNKGPHKAAPQVLVLAPPLIKQTSNLHPQFDATSIQKSKELPALYEKMAQEEECEFLDSSLIAFPSDKDGIHFEASQCKNLGIEIANKIKQMINAPHVRSNMGKLLPPLLRGFRL